MYKAKVIVTLKPEILDVRGRTISDSLKHLELNDVSDMRCGKYFEFSINNDNEEAARFEVDKLCIQLLSNTVIENYEIQLSKCQPA